MRCAALMGVLAALLVLTPAPPVPADDRADALIAGAGRAARAAGTLRAGLVVVYDTGDSKTLYEGAVRLMRPNYGRVEMRAKSGTAARVAVSTGADVYTLIESSRQYLKRPARPQGEDLNITGYPDASPIAAFLDPDALAGRGERRFLGSEKVDGQPYQVVQVTSGERGPHNRKLFFGASGLLEGAELSGFGAGSRRSVTIWLRNPRAGDPMKAEEFAYTPPPDYKPFTVRPVVNVARAPLDASLVPVGKAAPSFLLPQPGGGQLSLEDALRGKKAVLVNFWFHG